LAVALAVFASTDSVSVVQLIKIAIKANITNCIFFIFVKI
jgi:hypothetical protein